MKRPATITEGEAYAIAQQLNPVDSQIWRLLCETGARISDILRLTHAEIRRQPLIIYESKSRRTRTITLSKTLHDELTRWYPADNAEFAFYSVKNVRLHYNRSTYYRHLQRATIALKIAFSAHSARKLYARRIYDRTKNIIDVQNALHHRYITTTATYLDIDIATLIINHVGYMP